MINWKETTLDKAIDLVIDHRGLTPKKLGGDWSNTGYRAVSAKSIKNGQLVNEDQMNLLPESLYKKWMKVEVEYGDILLTSEAPLGEHIIWESEEKLVLSQRIFGLRTKKEILDPFFFNYFIDSKYYQHQLKSRESGSTVTGIKQSELLKTKILLPPIEEQKEIAGVLSSLDDKIELLREENKTLEATAQAIFKEWFVNFNFSNAEGKPYKSSGGKMVDSELGEIPEGWRVGKIEELCKKLASGGTPSTTNADYYGGDIDWFSTKELQDDYIFVSDKKITKEGLENSSAKIFPKGSIVMAIYAAPTVGRLGILGKDATFNQAACGFVANEKVCSNEYIYLLLHFLRDDFNGLANGAAQQNLNVGLVKNFAITIPEKSIMDQFNLVILPIFKKILNNTSQIQTLSALRDTLLPKLMSGNLKID